MVEVVHNELLVALKKPKESSIVDNDVSSISDLEDPLENIVPSSLLLGALDGL